jgi:predicted nucleic acid-binding protein
MSRVFWDTNLFIYLIEDSGVRGRRVVDLAERMMERGDQLFTSVLTLGEILIKPLEKQRPDLQEAYEALFSENAILIPFDREAARIYANVRQDRAISPPDAIQLSCAAAARIDMFVTNDDRLSRKRVPGIQFLVSLDRSFL